AAAPADDLLAAVTSLHEAPRHVVDARGHLLRQLVVLGSTTARTRHLLRLERVLDVVRLQDGVTRERALTALALGLLAASRGVLLALTRAISLVRRDLDAFGLRAEQLALELRDLTAKTVQLGV